MTVERPNSRPAPLPAIVRRIMRKHGLTEPSARAVIALAHKDTPLYGW